MNFSEISGQRVRDQNTRACVEISNAIKTSFGPISFDKMIINETGDITFTNDGANILKRLEVYHPAAKIFIDLSSQQDEEIGDGTTSVILIASELIKRANNLIKQKIHPSLIISAYRLAMCYTCLEIRRNLTISRNLFGFSFFLNVAKTTLCSKILGFNLKKFSKLAFQVTNSVCIVEEKKKKKKCHIKAVNFVKIYGNSMNASCIFDGCAFEYQKASPIMTNHVSSVKIVCFNFDLKIHKSRSKVSIKTENPFEIKKIFKKKLEFIVCYIKKLIEAGINLVFTSKSVDDFIVKYLIKNGIAAIKRTTDVFLKKIAMVAGLKIQNKLHTHTQRGLETVCIGESEEFFDQKITHTNLILVRGCRFCTSSSVILRGATEFLLEEIAQALHDATCMIRKIIEKSSLITGGGSVETSVHIRLEKIASAVTTREQLGILEFAEALLIIPKTLYKNAGLDYIETLYKIKIMHTIFSEYKVSKFKHFGVNLSTGRIADYLSNGVIEPLVNKIKCIQVATEAAITLLRIDDFIMTIKK